MLFTSFCCGLLVLLNPVLDFWFVLDRFGMFCFKEPVALCIFYSGGAIKRLLHVHEELLTHLELLADAT